MNTDKIKYIPGTYAKRTPDATHLVDHYVKNWGKKWIELNKEEFDRNIHPCICFSRKIGVGALEVADILGERTGFPVADREVIEHMSQDKNLTHKTVSFFDERYPGKINELVAFFFGEKSFVMNDYMKQLFVTAVSISAIEPTIFVGRGIHLILPRNRVLAVRLICSKKYRIRRLSSILNVKEKDMEAQLENIDGEQMAFFKKVFKKQSASPYEFDICINCDHISGYNKIADIVQEAFIKKFDKDL